MNNVGGSGVGVDRKVRFAIGRLPVLEGLTVKYQMVFVPNAGTRHKNGSQPKKRRRNSVLLLTYEGAGYCLRDFSAATGSGEEVERQTDTGLTPEDILVEAGQHCYAVPVQVQNAGVDNHAVYHRLTWELNSRHLRPECLCPACQAVAQAPVLIAMAPV
jgi:hypothetical protein